jgi:hypothetical protein
VSRLHFPLAWPLNCFQLPSMRFQSMTHCVLSSANGALPKSSTREDFCHIVSSEKQQLRRKPPSNCETKQLHLRV